MDTNKTIFCKQISEKLALIDRLLRMISYETVIPKTQNNMFKQLQVAISYDKPGTIQHRNQ